MPEIIIPGPEGRLEARYQKGNLNNSPLCVVLHPHPRQGGTMNNKLVYRGRLDSSSPGNNKEINGEDLRNSIEVSLKNEKINQNQFPSMGCNVKWK
mgnify:CR=1 FL=1